MFEVRPAASDPFVVRSSPHSQCCPSAGSMPTMERCAELREDAFADDLELLDDMCSWTEAEVVAYFESGGQERPAAAVAVAGLEKLSLDAGAEQKGQSEAELELESSARSTVELESMLSTIDGWVPGGRGGADTHLMHADDHPGQGLGDEVIDEDAEGEAADPLDEVDASGEERTEDAMLGVDPRGMDSVPVTSSPPGSDGDDVDGWGVYQLREFLRSQGVGVAGLPEKGDLVAEVRRLLKQQREESGPAGGSTARDGHGGGTDAPAGGGTPGGGAPSVKLSRFIRKVEDIKATGDAAYRAKDFEKADRHYTSALKAAADCGEALPATLLGAIYSNRSGNRAQLQRNHEALQDGQMALRYRSGWSRAYSRIGAALYAMREYDDAHAIYEKGLSANPGNVELQQGLAAVLSKHGASAAGSGTATEAKERGNAAFKRGQYDEAVVAYTEALRLAPSDETLYSNRSAAYANLERNREALDDAKRALSLSPKWPKAYSRAGLAALRLRDEEAAYWFYSNGARHELTHEMVNGRMSAMEALLALDSTRNRRAVERFKRDAARPPKRLFAISDVHYDHAGAKEWASGLSTTAYKDDAIILAGDCGDTFTAVKYCLRAFKACFRRVFYCPGNHDLWIRPKGAHSDEPAMFADSIQKLTSLWQLCDELDVDVGPAMLSPRMVVLPLDAWYSCTFDHHDPKPGSTLFDKFCKWPLPYDDVWRFMCKLNVAKLAMIDTHGGPLGAPSADVVTFSHFLPRKELPLPGVYEMAKASGCLEIETQLRRAGSKMHIFGHTHINTSHDLDGVTYMQNAMGYGISPHAKLTVVHDGGQFKTYLA